MTTPIAASFPVSSRFVPTFLENIIDKKISGIALNMIERLLHQICSWLYWPYRNLYREKQSRVHTFSDNQTRLFDATRDKSAKIEFEWGNDYITINGNKVPFTNNPQFEVVFSRQKYTDYVVVKDARERGPGWFQIIEQELPRESNPSPLEKAWVYRAGSEQPPVVQIHI